MEYLILILHIVPYLVIHMGKLKIRESPMDLRLTWNWPKLAILDPLKSRKWLLSAKIGFQIQKYTNIGGRSIFSWHPVHVLISRQSCARSQDVRDWSWITKVMGRRTKCWAMTHFHGILLGHDTYERKIVGSRHFFWYHKNALQPVTLVIYDQSLMIKLT